MSNVPSKKPSKKKSKKVSKKTDKTQSSKKPKKSSSKSSKTTVKKVVKKGEPIEVGSKPSYSITKRILLVVILGLIGLLVYLAVTNTPKEPETPPEDPNTGNGTDTDTGNGTGTEGGSTSTGTGNEVVNIKLTFKIHNSDIDEFTREFTPDTPVSSVKDNIIAYIQETHGEFFTANETRIRDSALRQNDTDMDGAVSVSTLDSSKTITVGFDEIVVVIHHRFHQPNLLSFQEQKLMRVQ